MFSVEAIIAAALLVGLLVGYGRAVKRERFPSAGWWAIGVVCLMEFMHLVEVPYSGMLLLPVVMISYVVVIDSAVFGLQGESLIRTHTDVFVWKATLSIFLWVAFEICNERIAAWHYGGLPNNESRYILQGLCFATIWPAICVTHDLLRETVWRRSDPAQSGYRGGAVWVVAGLGMLCLVVALAVPADQQFTLLILGITGVCDGLNHRSGFPAVWPRLGSLLASGLVCGTIWAWWNTRAAARLYSTAAEVMLFELPAEGFINFALFGPATFATYVFVASRLNLASSDTQSQSS